MLHQSIREKLSKQDTRRQTRHKTQEDKQDTRHKKTNKTNQTKRIKAKVSIDHGSFSWFCSEIKQRTEQISLLIKPRKKQYKEQRQNPQGLWNIRCRILYLNAMSRWCRWGVDGVWMGGRWGVDEV